jgi:ABC-type sugar transport system ATPase subunit
VWVVELLGSEKLVEVELSDKRRIIVQVRADRPVRVDELVGVRLNAKSVHIFDARKGRTLRPKTSDN